jgi:hypothetical protein
MPAPIPKRDRKVYVAGAGLSCALGLPNTAGLLDGVFELARSKKRWGISEKLPDRLQAAFRFFYPDAVYQGFRPDVVDFFSALRTYVDIGSGFAGGFVDAPALHRSLKFAIAHLLIDRTRAVNEELAADHPYLRQVVAPGNIVITSNWDLIIERYAELHGVPVRHRFRPDTEDSELTLLKLHGSVDWCLSTAMNERYPDSDFAMLGMRLFSERPYEKKIPSRSKRTEDLAVRVRALEHWRGAWRLVTSRADDLYMVTMARGKAGDLGGLREVWRDAYRAINRAQTLEIVGYSMPSDDIEIRALLRAGVQRGLGDQAIVVRNPSPDVHVRLRQYLDRDLTSVYDSVPSFG